MGSLIALVVHEGEDWQDVQVPVDSGAPASVDAGGAALAPPPEGTAPPVKEPASTEKSVVEEDL